MVTRDIETREVLRRELHMKIDNQCKLQPLKEITRNINQVITISISLICKEFNIVHYL